MKLLRGYFRIISDDRTGLLIAGSGFVPAIVDIGRGHYMGYAWLALSIVIGVQAWRDLGLAVRA